MKSDTSPPLRILYHHRTIGDGAEGIHIRELIRAFRETGNKVYVVALVGEDPSKIHPEVLIDPLQNHWSKLSRLLPGVIYEFAEIGYNFVGRRKIEKAIRKFQPDLIYDRYNSFSTAAIRAGKRFGVPVFIEVNAPLAYERSVYEGRPLRLARLARRYERYISNNADHVFAVSTPLKEFLVSNYSVPTSQITVLPNGVDPDKFNPVINGEKIRRRLGITNKRVIGFVGILRPWHGLDMLLRVIRDIIPDHPEVHLLIVGDGPIEQNLKDQVRSSALTEHVSFTGRIGHDEMSEYIAAMDIAVSPRTTFYASPMKILEYMAMGIATVAPDTANIRDLMTDGVSGKLFARDDEQALRIAIQSLLDDPDQAKRLGESARRKVALQLNWVQIAQSVVKLACGKKRVQAKNSI